MALNCKTGDMAIIIGGMSHNKNVGKIVKIGKFIGDLKKGYNYKQLKRKLLVDASNVWTIHSDTDNLIVHEYTFGFITDTLYVNESLSSDHFLRPIKGLTKEEIDEILNQVPETV